MSSPIISENPQNWHDKYKIPVTTSATPPPTHNISASPYASLDLPFAPSEEKLWMESYGELWKKEQAAQQLAIPWGEGAVDDLQQGATQLISQITVAKQFLQEKDSQKWPFEKGWIPLKAQDGYLWFYIDHAKGEIGFFHPPSLTIPSQDTEEVPSSIENLALLHIPENRQEKSPQPELFVRVYTRFSAKHLLERSFLNHLKQAQGVRTAKELGECIRTYTEAQPLSIPSIDEAPHLYARVNPYNLCEITPPEERLFFLALAQTKHLSPERAAGFYTRAQFLQGLQRLSQMTPEALISCGKTRFDAVLQTAPGEVRSFLQEAKKWSDRLSGQPFILDFLTKPQTIANEIFEALKKALPSEAALDAWREELAKLEKSSPVLTDLKPLLSWAMLPYQLLAEQRRLAQVCLEKTALLQPEDQNYLVLQETRAFRAFSHNLSSDLPVKPPTDPATIPALLPSTSLFPQPLPATPPPIQFPELPPQEPIEITTASVQARITLDFTRRSPLTQKTPPAQESPYADKLQELLNWLTGANDYAIAQVPLPDDPFWKTFDEDPDISLDTLYPSITTFLKNYRHLLSAPAFSSLRENQHLAFLIVIARNVAFHLLKKIENPSYNSIEAESICIEFLTRDRYTSQESKYIYANYHVNMHRNAARLSKYLLKKENYSYRDVDQFRRTHLHTQERLKNFFFRKFEEVLTAEYDSNENFKQAICKKYKRSPTTARQHLPALARHLSSSFGIENLDDYLLSPQTKAHLCLLNLLLKNRPEPQLPERSFYTLANRNDRKIERDWLLTYLPSSESYYDPNYRGPLTHSHWHATLDLIKTWVKDPPRYRELKYEDIELRLYHFDTIHHLLQTEDGLKTLRIDFPNFIKETSLILIDALNQNPPEGEKRALVYHLVGLLTLAHNFRYFLEKLTNDEAFTKNYADYLLLLADVCLQHPSLTCHISSTHLKLRQPISELPDAYQAPIFLWQIAKGIINKNDQEEKIRLHPFLLRTALSYTLLTVFNLVVPPDTPIDEKETAFTLRKKILQQQTTNPLPPPFPQDVRSALEQKLGHPIDLLPVQEHYWRILNSPFYCNEKGQLWQVHEGEILLYDASIAQDPRWEGLIQEKDLCFRSESGIYWIWREGKFLYYTDKEGFVTRCTDGALRAIQCPFIWWQKQPSSSFMVPLSLSFNEKEIATITVQQEINYTLEPRSYPGYKLALPDPTLIYQGIPLGRFPRFCNDAGDTLFLCPRLKQDPIALFFRDGRFFTEEPWELLSLALALHDPISCAAILHNQRFSPAVSPRQKAILQELKGYIITHLKNPLFALSLVPLLCLEERCSGDNSLFFDKSVEPQHLMTLYLSYQQTKSTSPFHLSKATEEHFLHRLKRRLTLEEAFIYKQPWYLRALGLFGLSLTMNARDFERLTICRVYYHALFAPMTHTRWHHMQTGLLSHTPSARYSLESFSTFTQIKQIEDLSHARWQVINSLQDHIETCIKQGQSPSDLTTENAIHLMRDPPSEEKISARCIDYYTLATSSDPAIRKKFIEWISFVPQNASTCRWLAYVAHHPTRFLSTQALYAKETKKQQAYENMDKAYENFEKSKKPKDLISAWVAQLKLLPFRSRFTAYFPTVPGTIATKIRPLLKGFTSVLFMVKGVFTPLPKERVSFIRPFRTYKPQAEAIQCSLQPIDEEIDHFLASPEATQLTKVTEKIAETHLKLTTMKTTIIWWANGERLLKRINWEKIQKLVYQHRTYGYQKHLSDPQKIDQIAMGVYEYLTLKTRLYQLQRLEKALEENLETQAHFERAQKRGYNIDEADKRVLLFIESAFPKGLIRENQVEKILLMAPETLSPFVKEALMRTGFGKTDVVLPALDEWLAGKKAEIVPTKAVRIGEKAKWVEQQPALTLRERAKQAVLNIWPSALATLNARSLWHKVHTAFGKGILEIHLTPELIMNSSAMETLGAQIERAQRKQEAISLRAADICCLILSTIQMLHALDMGQTADPDRRHHAEVLIKIVRVLLSSSSVTIDEIQEIGHPLQMVLFALGDQVTAPKYAATFACDFFEQLLLNDAFKTFIERNEALDPESHKIQTAQFLVSVNGWLNQQQGPCKALAKGYKALIAEAAFAGEVNVTMGLSSHFSSSFKGAIPFTAKDRPKEDPSSAGPSQFCNVDETLLKTVRSYYVIGLTHKQIVELLITLQTQWIAAKAVGESAETNNDFKSLKKFCALFKLQIHEQILLDGLLTEAQITTLISPEAAAAETRNFDLIRTYILECATPTITTHTLTTRLTPQDLLRLFNRSISLSATPPDPKVHSKETTFIPDAEDIKAQTETLKKAIQHVQSTPAEEQTFFASVIQACIKDNVRALIDPNAQLKALGSNKKIAEQLASRIQASPELKEIEYLVYFDEKSQERLRLHIPTMVSLPFNDHEPMKSFILFDADRTTGTDFVQPPGAQGILLAGPSLILTKAIQSGGRMRGLHKKQTLQVWTSKKIDHVQNAETFIKFCINNQESEEKKINLSFFKNMMDSELRIPLLQQVFAIPQNDEAVTFAAPVDLKGVLERFRANKPYIINQQTYDPESSYGDLEHPVSGAEALDNHQQQVLRQTALYLPEQQSSIEVALEKHRENATQMPLVEQTFSVNTGLTQEVTVQQELQQELSVTTTTYSPAPRRTRDYSWPALNKLRLTTESTILDAIQKVSFAEKKLATTKNPASGDFFLRFFKKIYWRGVLARARMRVRILGRQADNVSFFPVKEVLQVKVAEELLPAIPFFQDNLFVSSNFCDIYAYNPTYLSDPRYQESLNRLLLIKQGDRYQAIALSAYDQEQVYTMLHDQNVYQEGSPYGLLLYDLVQDTVIQRSTTPFSDDDLQHPTVQELIAQAHILAGHTEGAAPPGLQHSMQRIDKKARFALKQLCLKFVESHKKLNAKAWLDRNIK